jgi:hypothetical protein
MMTYKGGGEGVLSNKKLLKVQAICSQMGQAAGENFMFLIENLLEPLPLRPVTEELENKNEK